MKVEEQKARVIAVDLLRLLRELPERTHIDIVSNLLPDSGYQVMNDFDLMCESEENEDSLPYES